jgi:RNA polymerase sigma-70 factor (ECF subfamily)
MAFSSAATISNLDQPPQLTPATQTGRRDFASVYAEHSRPIYYLTLRLLGDSTRAEDAVHDVFLKAFRNLAGFRSAASMRTWLYRIAINHCQNLQHTWHQRHVTTTDDPLVLDAAPLRQESPLCVAEARELGVRIQRALDAIAIDYRLILLLVADDELTYEEVGVLTRQSADAVRGKLYRARKAFALEFQKTA